MYTLEQKIQIIENSNSFADLNKEVLPRAYKEDYYFVSYSHKDYKQVMKDILLLEDQGVNVWYDSDMHIGENWEDVAEMYISKFHCKGIIFYLSKNSILSKACNKEIEYVLENNKQFFSINLPLEDGAEVKSGLSMLLELKQQGYAVSQELEDNFTKAFSDKMLYLSYEDNIQRKKEQIENLKGEEVFVFTSEFGSSSGNSSKLSECRDNGFIKIHLKNNYEVNDPTSNDYGSMLPLRHIDKCAFANSFKLSEVILPQRTYEIEEYAFVNCYKLKSINLNGGDLVYIRDHAFSKCKSLDINEIDCNFIYKFAFNDCISLKDVQLNVNQLGSFAFRGCTQLQSVTFKKEPILFDSYAFENCHNLKQIGMVGKENVIEVKKQSELVIKDYCFENCNLITELTLSGKINLDTARGAFAYCKSLQKFHFKLSKKPMKLSPAFFTHCRSLNEVTGLENVKIYEEDCFYECNNLANINLEKAVEIGHRAFACTAIKEVVLPNVRKIAKQAFAATDTITKVVIGSKLKELDEYAFYGLDYLKYIEIKSKRFKYDVDCFMFVEPEVFVLSNLKFLRDYLTNKGINKLKTIYLESGLTTAKELTSLGMAIITQEQSDKEGYDKFVIGRENKYGVHIGQIVIIYLNNGEMDYTMCSGAGFDEEKQEYYVTTPDKKYYDSEISSIVKTYRL